MSWDDQLAQWIPIAKFEAPYSDTDRELERVQLVILDRLALGGFGA